MEFVWSIWWTCWELLCISLHENFCPINLDHCISKSDLPVTVKGSIVYLFLQVWLPLFSCLNLLQSSFLVLHFLPHVKTKGNKLTNKVGKMITYTLSEFNCFWSFLSSTGNEGWIPRSRLILATHFSLWCTLVQWSLKFSHTILKIPTFIQFFFPLPYVYLPIFGGRGCNLNCLR